MPSDSAYTDFELALKELINKQIPEMHKILTNNKVNDKEKILIDVLSEYLILPKQSTNKEAVVKLPKVSIDFLM